MTLRIAPGFTIPDTAVTETFAMLAKRGMGKSNAAVVMAEEMYRNGDQWVAIDPKGDWWGIRSSGDGTGAGLPVPVFGGRHGDIPLEATAGTMLANLIVERGLTAVLDVSLFSKGDQVRFVTDFAEALFRAAGDDPHPLHLFLEEAEEFLPQRVDARAARMVGAYSKIAKQGRTLGLGVTLITQRSASLNKDALSQTDTLILFRTVGPHDRKAVTAWAEYHAELGEIAATLASLDPGESWILSPGFLGTIERVRWRRRTTFDSGATPVTRGANRAAPVSLADIDLAEIKEQMAETIEQAKADDPKILRARIRELERQIAASAPETIIERVEIEVVPQSAVELALRAHDHATVAVASLTEIVEAFQSMAARSGGGSVGESARPPSKPDQRVGLTTRASSSPPVRSSVSPSAPTTTGDVELKDAHRLFLGVLADYPDGRTIAQLCMLAGRSKKSSAVSSTLAELRRWEFITTGSPMRLTSAGFDAVGVDPNRAAALTGPALVDHWAAKLNPTEVLMLRVFADAYPDPILGLPVLCELIDRSPTSSAVSSALANLRSLGLVHGWTATPELV